MPLLTRVWIRTALGCLVLSLLAGLFFSLGEVVPALRPPIPWATYFHLLAVGWLTNLIFGVAWWLFPPLSRELPRGPESLGWCAYGCLNAALVMRVVGEPILAGASPRPLAAALLIASAALSFASAVMMAVVLGLRARPPAGR